MSEEECGCQNPKLCDHSFERHGVIFEASPDILAMAMNEESLTVSALKLLWKAWSAPTAG